MFQVNQPNNTEVLVALVEHKRTVNWWGRSYQVTPRVCWRVFGDGKQLLAIWPINFRPHYFVVRVDSAWHIDCDLDNSCSGENCFYENLDDIYDTLDEGFAIDMLTEFGLDVDESEDAELPTLFDCGSSWGEFDWPGTKSHLWNKEQPTDAR